MTLPEIYWYSIAAFLHTQNLHGDPPFGPHKFISYEHISPPIVDSWHGEAQQVGKFTSKFIEPVLFSPLARSCVEGRWRESASESFLNGHLIFISKCYQTEAVLLCAGDLPNNNSGEKAGIPSISSAGLQAIGGAVP